LSKFQFIKYLILGGELPSLQKRNIAFTPFGEEKKSFTEFYNDNIFPKALEIEQHRIKILRLFRQRCLISILLCLVIITLFNFFAPSSLNSNGNSYSFWMTVAVLVGLGIWSLVPIIKYETSIKEQIYPIIFKFFGDFEYHAESDMSLPYIASFDILPPSNYTYLTDSVKGSYKDINLHLCEASFSVQPNTTTFTGLVILFSMNKNFNGKTMVRSKSNLSSMDLLTRTYITVYQKLTKSQLEDPVFNEKFDVYTTDQVEARYLLTTSFMQRLIDLSNAYASALVECCFFEKSLLVIIPTNQNYFSDTSSAFVPVTFEDDINNIIQQMTNIFGIIDLLKLHDKTKL
jgi:hypothetical protein